MNEFRIEGIEKLIDNREVEVNCSHILRGDEDMCLNYFGEQDKECIKINEKNKSTNM